jgi:hypothetical protein
MSWEDYKIENSPKPYKRNNWTNDEIMEILKGLMIDPTHIGLPPFDTEKAKNEFVEEWNFALETAVSQFYDFNRPDTDHGACAMTPEGEIVVIGPVLPI